MKRSIRTSIATIAIAIIVLFLYHAYQTTKLRTLVLEEKERYKAMNKEHEEEHVVAVSPGEKFMSFFPHGDFATQHEAVRNAFRIALETNRTLILPQLRLGQKNIPWAPFPALQKYYESQDKELLKSLCTRGKKNDWRLKYHSCEDLNDWIELPWSMFFDLKALQTQFKIRIHERAWGHGWGVNEASLSHLELAKSDIAILDPNSFPSNGSDWDTSEQKQHVMSSNGFLGFISNAPFHRIPSETESSLELKKPLKMLVTSQQLKGLQERYVQFGSLVYGLRFQTTINKRQNALQKALRSNVFVAPNKLHEVNVVANKIIKKLGGSRQFNMVHMNLESLTKTELENQRLMNRAEAEIEGRRFVDGTREFYPNGTALSAYELLNQLDESIQTELMASLVRELQGDMPINQAISATLPFQSSELKDTLSKSGLKDRENLLSACIDYRKTVDERYPIYFLTNDVYLDIIGHPELFGPLLKAFPCTFTKKDIYEWGVVKSNWTDEIHALRDSDIDYESALSIIVETLIARKSYSFFEVPTTKLTRLISWR
ncbi:MAG: hypothetical protein EXX96DRAFT_555629 [Benjaminiella poitrasii]|nr:MAG: hypothetical protein EXX96DRAFT_555629 [Benjaminiella poitrasii]